MAHEVKTSHSFYILYIDDDMAGKSLEKLSDQLKTP